MNELVLEVSAFYDISMVRNLRLQITYDQLVEVLATLAPSENPLEIEAHELLDYIRNEGQAASFLKLSGRGEDVDGLFDLIAHRACLMPVKCERISAYKLDEGDIQFATCEKKSVC